MWSIEEEREFREILFQAVLEFANKQDGMVSRQDVSEFHFAGENLRLIDPQGGIWNPSASWTLTDPLRSTLSINTTLSGIYDDQEISGGLWRYDYQAGGSEGKNTKLRLAWELQLPVLWLRQQEPSGRYVPYIVFVVDDFPNENFCFIAPDLSLSMTIKTGNEIERKYAERLMKQRLHQPAFRARVLNAYKVRCAVCNLQFGELLEGAHITPDNDPDSSTSVSNGISLCKMHHAAYDREFLGIDTDFVVQVRADILKISDGPMLQYGLQKMHERELLLPDLEINWPDKVRLDQRYLKFKKKEQGEVKNRI